MERADIPRLFVKAVQQYLTEAKLSYNKGKYPFSEKELQKSFALALMEANIPFSKERLYQGNKKRIDFRLFDGLDVEIEIEWEAKWTDGFAKRTFDDLHKLDMIAPKKWGMFLAVNIGNKYERAAHQRKSMTSAEPFSKTTTVLARKWEAAQTHDLLKCNPRFWRWRYDKECDVTILSCFGQRTKFGWRVA